MQQYSNEIKAQVIADAQLGMAKAAIAKKHGIPRSTVRLWTQDEPLPLVATQNREDLGQLVYEYLAAGLKALGAQARVMGDPEWFKGQGETAHFLHGVLADKLVIVFGGIERGQEPGDD